MMKFVSKVVSFQPCLPVIMLSVFLQIIAVSASTVKAHELWLESAIPMINANNQIEIDIRLGQMFSGSAQFFIPDQAVMLKRLTADGAILLTPRPGDRPAISFPAAADAGHTVIAYETIGFYLTYKEWDKFVAFAQNKKASDILDQHLARQLSRDHFKERYKRFAKISLFMTAANRQVNDATTGMEIEFIITNVEFISDTSQSVTARLIYQGQPMINVPVTVFTRAPDGAVMTTDLNTDDQGKVRLQTETGYDYMLDHVLFRAIDPADDPKGAAWETLWASHVF